MSLRQVVLPEPEGPSMEKNSPSSTTRLTSSTALTAPKARVTPASSIADGTCLFPAHHPDVVLGPLRIRDALALRLALGGRRLPEADLLEAVEAVGLATVLAE